MGEFSWDSVQTSVQNDGFLVRLNNFTPDSELNYASFFLDHK